MCRVEFQLLRVIDLLNDLNFQQRSSFSASASFFSLMIFCSYFHPSRSGIRLSKSSFNNDHFLFLSLHARARCVCACVLLTCVKMIERYLATSSKRDSKTNSSTKVSIYTNTNVGFDISILFWGLA